MSLVNAVERYLKPESPINLFLLKFKVRLERLMSLLKEAER